jgi:hypothetical protein
MREREPQAIGFLGFLNPEDPEKSEKVKKRKMANNKRRGKLLGYNE